MGCGFSLKKWQTRWQKSFEDSPEESKKENENDNKKMYEHLQKIATSSFPGNVKKMREEGTRLIYSGSFGVIGKELITHLQPKKQSGGDTDQEKSGEKDNYPLLSIQFATDGSDAICEGVLQYEYLFSKLLSKMEELLESIKTADDPQKSKLYKALLPYVCIVHNIATYVEDLEVREDDKDLYDATAYVQKQMDPFTEKDQRQTAIDILSECTSFRNKTIRLKSKVALACLVRKSQGKEFVEWQGGLTSPMVVETLFKHLRLALNDKKKHQSHECSALAIERGLRHLLRIYDKHILDLLVKGRVWKDLLTGLKEAKTDEEVEACFFSLWLLHLNKEWLQEMQKDKTLEDLAAHAAGRKCVKNTKRAEDLQKALERLRDQRSKPQTSPSGRHVMLSYCHKNKTLVEKIADRLKSEGVDLWVDSERIHMNNDMYSAMAEAVTEASTVIVCMSQGYFESRNCRREVMLACDKGKTVIPLVVEKGYRAESWLAIIIAGIIYHDLTKENDFEDEFRKVLEKIKGVLKNDSDSKDASAKASPDSTAPPASKQQDQPNQHEQTASRRSTVPPTSKEQPLQHEKQTASRRSTVPPTSKEQPLQHEKQTASRHSTVPLTSKEQPLQHEDQTASRRSTVPPTSKEQPLQHEKQTASRRSTVPPTSKEQPLQHEKQTTSRGSTAPSTSKQQDQILQHAKQTYASGNGTRRSVKFSTKDANTTQSQQYLPQDRSVECGEDSIELGKNELLYRVKLPHVVPEVFHKRMGKGLMMKTAHEVSRLTEVLNGYQLSSGSMTVVHCTF